MHKKIKKQISNANSYLKKSHKIISILVVFLLISTVMASAASSARIGSRLADRVSEEIKDAVESEKPLKTYIAEKAEEIKDKAQNVKEKLNEKITQIKENRKSIGAKTTGILSKIASFVESIRSFLSIRKSAASGKYLYTKYGDNEPIESKMYILKATKVDLNDDGINDIEARYKIRPGLERSPLALSCNIALTVKRIDDGFKHLDINESFEAYIYMTFPGLLNSKIAGNQVKFGYHSEKGEEIPSLCDVKYTYVPYFLYVAKPLHRTTLNAGSSTDADKLGLIFSYLNNQAENKSKDIFDIQLEPVVDTTVTFCGLSGSYGRGLYFDSSEETKATIKYTKYKGEDSNFTAGLIIDKISDFEIEVELTPLSLGGGRVEYYKNSTEPLDVTLFFEKNSSAYIYAEDIPDHILFSWEPLKEGLIQLNSFGDRVSEVGIRNALEAEDVTTKAYIANLPSLMELRLDWKILRGGELTFYTDTSGCSAHLESSDILGNETQLFVNITSNENINISLFWSFINKTIGVKKTNTNISIAAYVIGKNGTMANFSCNIKNTITQPFVFNFGKLFDGNFEVEFTGNAIEINDLEAYVFIPGTGSFAALMEQFLLYKESGVTFSFNASEENNVTTVTIIVEILDGLIAKNISFWHNTTRFDVKDITANGYWYKEYNFYIQDANVEWGGNAANGYLKVYGESNVTFTFFSIHKINGELISRAKGSLSFETEEDDFYVQWNTTEDGNKTILMDGGGVLALSGFELWVKDRIDVSIPLFLGSFSIDSANKSGEIVIFLDDSVANIAFDVNISFANQDGFAIAASSSLHVDGYFELIIGVNKGVNNSKRINVTLEGEGLIQLSNANFYARFKTIEGPAEIDVDLGFLELDLNDIQGSIVNMTVGKIDGNSTFGINTSSFSGSIASFQILDFSASIYEAGISGLLFFNISEFTMDFSGSGGFLFELSQPDEDGIQYLTGAGEIFDEDGLIYIEKAEILALFIYIIIDEFLISGATTFHLDAQGELNFEGENFAEKLENFKLEAGCDALWSANKLSVANYDGIDFVDLIGLGNFTGIGDVSVGAEIFDIATLDGDVIVHINGNLAWDSLILLGFYLNKGDYEGDFELRIGFNGILGFINQNLTTASLKVKANTDVTINQFTLLTFLKSLELSMTEGFFDMDVNLTKGIKVDLNSTTDVTIYAAELVLGPFAISLATINIHPGKLSVYAKISSLTHGLVEINATDTMNPFIGRWNFRHINTGKNLTLKGLQFNIPYLKFGWDVNMDLIGYLAIDTNNETIYLSRTRIFGMLQILGELKAENFNLSWNFTGPLKEWIVKEGFIDPDISIGVNISGIWHYWNDPPGDGYLQGYVKAYGSPIEGALVECINDSDITDANGFYELTLSQGTHTITASKDGYYPLTANIAITGGETSTFTFNLDPIDEGTIHGMVYDNITHKGIPLALVTAQPGGNTNYTWQYGAQVGRFDMDLPVGTYDITVSKDGFESFTVYDVVVVDGDDLWLDDIYLRPLNYGGICGYVYGDDGYGLSRGVTVTVEIPGEDDLVSDTKVNGKFPSCYPSCTENYYAFDVAPGTYTVTFEHDEYYTYSEQVTVVAGEISEMDVTLDRKWYSPTGHTVSYTHLTLPTN